MEIDIDKDKIKTRLSSRYHIANEMKREELRKRGLQGEKPKKHP